MGLTRREFIGSALAAAALGACRPAGSIPGELLGPDKEMGHRLRSGGFPPPAGEEKVPVVVVGGGAAGLSCGWKLLRSGFKDFVVLELEPVPGGNARWGENAVSRYPWGAHYLPIPGPGARSVRALLGELKVVVGEEKGKPVYDEAVLCHAPEERIFTSGRWLDGLYPRLGATAADLADYKRFHAEISALRRARGSDGRPAFSIPMELSSRDPKYTSLDAMSMRAWLDSRGYRSARLRWYVEYATRDDFGGTLDEVSAWSGLQYYAGRGEGDDDRFLVWPEGNGFLVRSLAEALGPRVRRRALVYDVRPDGDGALVDWWDADAGVSRRLRAKRVVVAAPRFVARRVVAPLREDKTSSPFAYAPWFVANLTVEHPPAGVGAAPAWDNVLHESDGLGYVDATHQSFSQDRSRAVWTYYRPLTGSPDVRRKEAFAKPFSDWREECLTDLERALPGLRDTVTRLDGWVWGHGMVLPRPGFVWGAERRAASAPLGAVFFAHSDLSGGSVFEEANYRGVAAAEAVLASLGAPHTTSL